MKNIIRTSYQTNANGTGQILAKGGGKQRTTQVDLSKSAAWNHGVAAGALALVLGWEWHDGVETDSNDSGTKRGFAF